jgi:hypothetical protein
MAIKHLRDAYENGLEFGRPLDRAVYLEVAYWADSKGISRMSQGELAERVLLSPRFVAGSLVRLVQGDVLVKLGHGRYGLRSAGQMNPANLCDVCKEPASLTDEGASVITTLVDGDTVYQHYSCAVPED